MTPAVDFTSTRKSPMFTSAARTWFSEEFTSTTILRKFAVPSPLPSPSVNGSSLLQEGSKRANNVRQLNILNILFITL